MKKLYRHAAAWGGGREGDPFIKGGRGTPRPVRKKHRGMGAHARRRGTRTSCSTRTTWTTLYHPPHMRSRQGQGTPSHDDHGAASIGRRGGRRSGRCQDAGRVPAETDAGVRRLSPSGCQLVVQVRQATNGSPPGSRDRKYMRYFHVFLASSPLFLDLTAATHNCLHNWCDTNPCTAVPPRFGPAAATCVAPHPVGSSQPAVRSPPRGGATTTPPTPPPLPETPRGGSDRI